MDGQKIEEVNAIPSRYNMDSVEARTDDEGFLFRISTESILQMIKYFYFEEEKKTKYIWLKNPKLKEVK